MNPRAVYHDCIEAIGPLIRADAVAQRWDSESALPALTVGALAGHLLRALLPVESGLQPPEPLGEPDVDAAGYYARVVESSDLDAPVNVGVRERAAAQAAGGHEAVVGEYERARVAVMEAMRDEPSSRRIKVIGDLVIRLDDYLLTRIVELVVHGDDLAVTCDLPVPAFRKEAYDVAIRTLVDVARLRHGDLAVVRALARRERDAVQALRVL